MKIEFDSTNISDMEMMRKMVSDVAFDLDTPRRRGEMDDRVEIPQIPEIPGTPAALAPLEFAPASEIAEEVAAEVDADLAAEAEVDAEINADAEPAPERDKHGRVWDERIDSSNKKQTTANEWMKRKNVDDAVRQQVIAELSSDDSAAPADVFSPPTAPVASDLNTPPVPPVVAGAAAVGSTLDWGVVFTRTMDAKQKELVTDEQISAKIAEYGVSGGFPALIARADLYEKFLIELMIP